MIFDVILVWIITTFSHIKDDVSSKQTIKQANKKADYTVKLIWWGLLRLASINMVAICTYYVHNIRTIINSAERNNRIFGLFVRNGDIQMFQANRIFVCYFKASHLCTLAVC